jgi:hypothetical protein
MGQAAVRHAAGFEWPASVREFAGVLLRSLEESDRAGVRADAADLVALLERIRRDDDVAREPAVPLEVAAIGTAQPREPAPSGLA